MNKYGSPLFVDRLPDRPMILRFRVEEETRACGYDRSDKGQPFHSNLGRQ
jgi:hypothetical protein